MATFLRVMMARLRGHFRRGDLDRDFDQELAAHLAMAEEDKVRRGMTREEARRAARVELGGLTQLREASRDARGLPWIDTLWLDLKLGLRMLRKSWGLTLVGGLAMTVVIGTGAVVFAVFDLVFDGSLPLDDGDRVVALQTWDDKGHRRRDTSVADFERWRDALASVEDVGAFRAVERGLATADGAAGEPVPVAETTASGFELARVAPLLGRPLVEEDERDAADPVVVIGYDVWQSRFAADPAVIGRTVRLGDTVHTVVGVMPEGFAFPINHRFWTPLKAARSGSLPDGDGNTGVVFARLAPGVTLEGAEAELATLGLLPPAVAAESDEELRPRVLPYTFAMAGDLEHGDVLWMIRIVLLAVTLLLVPPCANVAILIYARTVTRQEEFAARYALGASRGRIVGQLFIETLVLAAGAAGVALVLARFALRLARASIDQSLSGGAPFWMDFTLSVETVLFVAGLAVLAAVIAGLVPALKATGGQMLSGLRALSGRTGMRLGATWTALVVAQVALSLAALPSAVEMVWGTIRKGVLGPGFAAEEFLTARLEMDRESRAGLADPPAAAVRFAAVQAELVRRLTAEPGVSGATVAAAVPGEEPWAVIEVDGVPLPDGGIFAAHNLVRFNRVDDVFFDVFDVPLLAGRGFGAGDFERAAAAVLVNQTFVRDLIGDASPLGRRVRYLRKGGVPAEPGSSTWYEIVGVVADLPAHATGGTMYHPLAPGQTHPASLALRAGSDSAGLAERLREIAMALDPALRLDEVLALDEVYRENEVGNNVGALSLAVVMLSVLLLSAAGICALMSFTVNRRRREIGIRCALGAQPHHVLSGIFRRAFGQLAAGAAGGILVAALLSYYLPVEAVGGWDVPGVIPAATLFMVMVGLLAAAGPARRGLRVEPTEALREG
ncbi:MAG TPA: ABC transporter permease [Thermoanaerobaculia bacterium]